MQEYRIDSRRASSVFRTAIVGGSTGDVDVELETGRRIIVVDGVDVVEEAA